MVKTFNTLRKIEMTEQQNQLLNAFISCAIKHDTKHEINTIYLSMLDITNGVLNSAISPIIFTNTKFPSDDLYESIKDETLFIPEYISREELLPAELITLWTREE